MSKFTLEQQHDLAKTLFPERYALALTLTGKRRNHTLANLRRRAVYATLIEPLRAAGRSCASCAAYSKVPMSLTGQHCCDDDSDFHGYAITTASDLCTDWRARK